MAVNIEYRLFDDEDGDGDGGLVDCSGLSRERGKGDRMGIVVGYRLIT